MIFSQFMKYLALLRGINVGGNNIIKMVDLKLCFEELGYTEVTTYIQSGNVLFSSKSRSINKIVADLQSALSKRFNYNSQVVALNKTQFAQVMTGVPSGYGTKPDTFRYDVIFVKAPLTANKALRELPMKAGVDNATAGKHALYFWRVKGKESQSNLSKIVQLKLYKQVTIRNWNTTSKLWELMNAER